MGSPENSNWVVDYPLINNIINSYGDFGAPSNGLLCTPQLSVESGGSLVNSAIVKESGSKKREMPESSYVPCSKASREKMRRDRLNDKFLELGSIMEPGKIPKTDKAAILVDAVKMVTELRIEAQKLKDSNGNLHEKINELKVEKNELRDEKQRLRQEKENLDQQIKMLNAGASFVPSPPFTAQGQTVAGQKKMMPVISYAGYPLWQFMPPADTDTTQDAKSCSPVA